MGAVACMDPRVGRNGHNCKPLVLTRYQVRLLLLASGHQLAWLTQAHASGQITGRELGRRIDFWRELIAKLDACLCDEEP